MSQTDHWKEYLNDLQIDLPDSTEPTPEAEPGFLEILEWATDETGLQFNFQYRPSMSEVNFLSDPFCSFIHTMQDICEIHFEYFCNDPDRIMLYPGMIFGSLQALLKGNRELKIHFMYESGQQNLRAFYIDLEDVDPRRTIRIKAEGCNVNAYPLTLQMQSNTKINRKKDIMANIIDLASFICDKQIEDS